MKRKVLIDGKEVDLTEVINPQAPGHNRMGNHLAESDHAAADEFATIREEMERIAVILQLTIQRKNKGREMGAGGYRFYDTW